MSRFNRGLHCPAPDWKDTGGELGKEKQRADPSFIALIHAGLKSARMMNAASQSN